MARVKQEARTNNYVKRPLDNHRTMTPAMVKLRTYALEKKWWRDEKPAKKPGRWQTKKVAQRRAKKLRAMWQTKKAAQRRAEKQRAKKAAQNQGHHLQKHE